jgi:bifunctional DNA-binding transcriptional regulator/antitoxin component of YhaV-PrlF toxin-antitoxin module
MLASTLISKSQTTIPAKVRKALGLQPSKIQLGKYYEVRLSLH